MEEQRMAVTTAANRGAPMSRHARRSNRLWDANMGGAERLASLLGARALVCIGWRRRGALGTGLIALGGWLAVRGVNGPLRSAEHTSGLQPRLRIAYDPI